MQTTDLNDPLLPGDQLNLDDVSNDLGDGASGSGSGFDLERGGDLEIASYSKSSFLSYMGSVVMGRALPDVCDGNKPVIRRTLYAMHNLGLTSTSKPIKSARVVGEALGKLHPHSDVALYEAAVRVSQEFSLRYPLIEGQGNFGSRDGDGAAAMRYTEMRLTPIAETMLDELNQDTVDFIPNYDNSFIEPVLLPNRMPMILLNGSSGIAVGMATEIPSHNLREVVAATLLVMKNPLATLDDVLEVLPAPDYPGGGQITVGASVLRDIYATGRGSIRMRSVWKKEELARGQWRVAVLEHSHNVSTAKILEQIEELSNPKIKAGKKELTIEQKNDKALIQSVLAEARNEGNKHSKVRLVLEPKNSKTSPEEMMAVLFGLTDLACSTPVNLTLIGKNRSPGPKSLLQIIKDWIDFRMEIVDRRIKNRLNQLRHRLHILQGRRSILLKMDEVIKIIRESDDAKEALMSLFDLSEVQVEDILEIKLRQLSKLEGIKIDAEIERLSQEESQLQFLLDNPDAFKSQVAKELEDDGKKFGDDRRTLIQPVDPVPRAEKVVVDEAITILLSRQGWVKARQGHGLDAKSFSWKPGDAEGQIIETRTTCPLIILDHKGLVYSIDASSLPSGRGDGVPLTSLIQLTDGGQPKHVFSDDPSATYLFTNSGGLGYISKVDDLIVKRGNSGKQFMVLEDGEEVLNPVKVTNMNHWVVACSRSDKEARMAIFPLNEVKVMPKGRGVIVMGLESGEKLSTIEILQTVESIKGARIKLANGQTVELTSQDMLRVVGKRARRGVVVAKKTAVISVERI